MANRTCTRKKPESREQRLLDALSISQRLSTTAAVASATEIKRKADRYPKLIQALGDIALCRIPGVPDRATVTSEQVATFARDRANAALKEAGEVA